MAPNTGAPHFFEALGNRLTDPIYTLVCAGKEYTINRLIDACHSRYFKSLFGDGLTENECTFEFEDENPAVIARLIIFFYTFDYDGTGLTLVNHVDMYLLADKYDVPDLKGVTIRMFCSEAGSNLDDTANILSAIKLVYQKTRVEHKDMRSACMVPFR